MQVWVNGMIQEVAEGMTVAGLISGKGLQPSNVVVEYNGDILNRAAWLDTLLTAQDKLEIVTFVGGG